MEIHTHQITCALFVFVLYYSIILYLREIEQELYCWIKKEKIQVPLDLEPSWMTMSPTLFQPLIKECRANHGDRKDMSEQSEGYLQRRLYSTKKKESVRKRLKINPFWVSLVKWDRKMLKLAFLTYLKGKYDFPYCTGFYCQVYKLYFTNLSYLSY